MIACCGIISIILSIVACSGCASVERGREPREISAPAPAASFEGEDADAWAKRLADADRKTRSDRDQHVGQDHYEHRDRRCRVDPAERRAVVPNQQA